MSAAAAAHEQEKDGNPASESALVNVPPGAQGAAPPKEGAPVVEQKFQTSGVIPQLQNVVATCNLGVKLDLKSIAMKARNAEYNPKRFSAVIMRIRDPKTTALIFSSGKMVVTGAKSEKFARLASRKYARIVQKLGFPEVSFKEFKIQNMVGSADVKFPIRLEGLAYDHEDYSSYEPELFPGLIYRMVQPKIVLLIFVSGKVILTGAKSREQIYEAFEAIYPTLCEFKKDAGGAGSGGAGASSAASLAAGSSAAPPAGLLGSGAGAGSGSGSGAGSGSGSGAGSGSGSGVPAYRSMSLI